MNDEEPSSTTPEPSEPLVAPPAHGPAGSRPAPPPWSYRAAGRPIETGGAGTAPADVTGAPHGEQATIGRVRPRPTGAPPLPGPARSAATSFGPTGRRRSPVAVVLLSVLTLGVYALVWHDRINAEMSDFDTRMRVRAASSTVAVVLPWLLGLLVTLAGAARIMVGVFHVHLPFDPHVTSMQGYYLLAGLGVVPYLDLVLPFSLVAIVMTLERIRVVEDRVGLTADVQLQPSHQVWWLVVPVLGGLAMIAAMQRRLNRVWEQAAPRPAGLRS
jgi:hypothetical protein